MTIPSPWGSNDGMAIAAVRYCLGRQTYIVGECVSWLRANWERIEPRARVIIQRDIEEELRRDDHARKDGLQHRPLGWDCDRAEWEKARKLWSEQSVASYCDECGCTHAQGENTVCPTWNGARTEPKP